MTERDLPETSPSVTQSLKGRFRIGVHSFMMKLGESYSAPFTIPTFRQVKFVTAVGLVTVALASGAPEKAQGVVVLAGFTIAVGAPIISDLYRRAFTFYNNQT